MIRQLPETPNLGDTGDLAGASGGPGGQPGGPGPKRRRLIAISFLPAAATLGNLLCGMLAILCCVATLGGLGAAPAGGWRSHIIEYLPTYISVGAYLILLSMIFDALDGSLARLTRRTSAFGAQLDSISDIVSFGVAPAVLLVSLFMRELSTLPTPAPAWDRALLRLATVAAALYACCAAIRLARFNVESSEPEEKKRRFSGLPTPGAALPAVGLIALHEAVHADTFALSLASWAGGLRWLMLPAFAALGWLMVSRVSYVHVFNVYLRRRRPPTDLLWVLAILGLGSFSLELLVLAAGVAYVCYGLVLHFAGEGTRAARA